jgi:hypothetical protein
VSLCGIKKESSIECPAPAIQSLVRNVPLFFSNLQQALSVPDFFHLFDIKEDDCNVLRLLSAVSVKVYYFTTNSSLGKLLLLE